MKHFWTYAGESGITLKRKEFFSKNVHSYRVCSFNNLGDKTILYLKFDRINSFVGVQSGTASVNTDSQWSKREV